jgi:hypothetical protein
MPYQTPSTPDLFEIIGAPDCGGNIAARIATLAGTRYQDQSGYRGTASPAAGRDSRKFRDEVPPPRHRPHMLTGRSAIYRQE